MAAGWVSGTPATIPLPVVGRMRPAISLISVVLPEPFGPTNPKISPGARANETSWSARTGGTFTLVSRSPRTAFRAHSAGPFHSSLVPRSETSAPA